ncbi:MAG: hypothetical protein E3J78_02915 [Candidatus Cloacimonadota bacterium]|nr:MAG: hypothetical protein E3J78_02915 [Candidatus Cloacimonadota bacterium]
MTKKRKRKYTKAPAITGIQLLRLFKKAGGKIVGRCDHGYAIQIFVKGQYRITTVQDRSDPIPPTTLGQILGPKQTFLGKRGLLNLLNEHGL